MTTGPKSSPDSSSGIDHEGKLKLDDSRESSATHESKIAFPNKDNYSPRPLPPTSTSTNLPTPSFTLTFTPTPRRVKVYHLSGDDWVDKGTGYCVGEINEDTKEAFFVVRGESKAKKIILKSKLEGTIQYQRQQETLIVWTDNTGLDLALSFQESEGCADLCEFIIKIQQSGICPEISLYYVTANAEDGEDLTELITGPIRFPPEPKNDNLDIVIECLSFGINSNYTRRKLSDYIISSGYFDKLCSFFNEAELNKDVTSLCQLNEVIRVIFHYNDHELIEKILSDESRVQSIVGMLEYNSSSCNSDVNSDSSFRNLLKRNSDIRLIVPIENIQQFKRIHYLVVLKDLVEYAGSFDDQVLYMLSSMIESHQMDILRRLGDVKFLQNLFKIYDTVVDIDGRDIDNNDNNDNNDSVNMEQKEVFSVKRDTARMIHQYAKLANSLQKSDFLSALCNAGLVKVILYALSDGDVSVKKLGLEMIIDVIDHDDIHPESPALSFTSDNLQQPSSTIETEDKESNNNNNNNKKKKSNKINEIDKNQFVCDQAIDMQGRDSRFLFAERLLLISGVSKILIDTSETSLIGYAFEAAKHLLKVNSDSIKKKESSQQNIENEIEEASSDLFIKIDEHINIGEHDDMSSREYLKLFYTTFAPYLFKNLIDIVELMTATTTTTTKTTTTTTTTTTTATTTSTATALVDKEKNLKSEKPLRYNDCLYQLYCELISVILSEHPPILVIPFLIEHDVLKGLAFLLVSEYGLVLKTHVVRCLKGIILQGHGKLNDYIMKEGILDKFMTFFASVAAKKNLATSTCLSLCDSLRNSYGSGDFEAKSSTRKIARYLVGNYRSFLLEQVRCSNLGERLVTLVNADNDGFQSDTSLCIDQIEIDTNADNIMLASSPQKICDAKYSIKDHSDEDGMFKERNGNDDKNDTSRECNINGNPETRIKDFDNRPKSEVVSVSDSGSSFEKMYNGSDGQDYQIGDKRAHESDENGHRRESSKVHGTIAGLNNDEKLKQEQSQGSEEQSREREGNKVYQLESANNELSPGSSSTSASTGTGSVLSDIEESSNPHTSDSKFETVKCALIEAGGSTVINGE